jgi:YHS domain-containing protein
MRNGIIASVVAALFVGTLIVPLTVDAKYHVPDLLRAKRAQSAEVQKAPSPDSVTLCPVSGKTADKAEFITYKGKTISFCCKNCEQPFLQNPSKYLDKHAKAGRIDVPWRGEFRS